MGNCVSTRAGLGEVSIAAEDSDFDSSSTQEEDDAGSNNNTVPVLSFFPVAGATSETTSSTTGGTIQNSHQNRNCVIEVHDGANTHTLLVSGLPMVQVSPSLTQITPRAANKSAIALDEDDPPAPQQKHHPSSSLLLLPPHTDDTSSSGSRTSPMMEPRAPSDPSPPSIVSCEWSFASICHWSGTVVF